MKNNEESFWRIYNQLRFDWKVYDWKVDVILDDTSRSIKYVCDGEIKADAIRISISITKLREIIYWTCEEVDIIFEWLYNSYTKNKLNEAA